MKIKIDKFKKIDSVEVELQALNIFIGPPAPERILSRGFTQFPLET
jgi:hypothetical protein